MTDDRKPDDALERYLKGDSKLSRAYRQASTESTPPVLDEAILAEARKAARPKPPLSARLAPWALAASLVLGVNLAWNLRNVAPETAAPAKTESAPDPYTSGRFAPLPSPTRREDVAMLPVEKPPSEVRNAYGPTLDELKVQMAEQIAQRKKEIRDEAQARRNSESDSLAKQKSEHAAMAERQESAKVARARESMAGSASAAPAAMADAAPPPVLTESQKIDRLISFIENMQGAVFIRNGSEYGAPEAAKHLQMKREKAGKRVKTADDFIRLCASHSYLSGEAYLIRDAQGRTRTAEEVLREQLARLNQ